MSNNPFMNLPATNTASSPPNPFMGLQPQDKPVLIPAIAGGAQQLADIGHNAAGFVAKRLDESGLTQNSQKNVDDFFSQNVDNFYKPYIDQNPNAALVGRIGGGIVGSAPLLVGGGAALVTKGAAGAAQGYLNSDPNASTGEKIFNTAAGAGLNMLPGGAVLSTAVGGGVGAGIAAANGGDIGTGALTGAGLGLTAYTGGKAVTSKTAMALIKSIKPTLTSPTDLANMATQKTLDSVGGDLSKVTSQQFFQQVDNLKNAAWQQKEELYKARNAIADKEGVGVFRINLGMLGRSLEKQVAEGASSETSSALAETNRLLGNGKMIPYEKAQSLVSDIGKQINTANRQGNYALADKLTPVRDALLRDIDGGGGSAAVKEANDAANTFYKNVYAPLRGLESKKILDEKFSEGKAINAAVTSVLKNPSATQAFAAANNAGLKNNLSEELYAAHVNALKDAATDEVSNTINPLKYGNSIAKTLSDNKSALAPIGDRLKTLGQALQVAQQAQGLRAGLSQHSIGQKIGLSLLAPAATGGATYLGTGGDLGESAKVAGATFLIPKAKYFYAVSKLLRNPETAALLDRAGKITEKTDPNLASTLMGYVRSAAQKAGMEVPYSDRELARGMNTAKIKVADTHVSTGGSTFDINGNNMIGQKKYSVSVFPDRGVVLDGGSVTPKDIEAFVNQNKDLFKDPKVAIGTWYDKEANKTYVDAVLSLDSKNAAMDLAKKYNQKAIFDLHHLQEIPTGGTGEAGNYTTKATARIPHNSSVYGKIIGRLPSTAIPALMNNDTQSQS